jgi:hypothetical protein
MLAGARLIQEKQNHMLERSSSQMQLEATSEYAIKSKPDINNYMDESVTKRGAKNLPVISESTEKLCTLKLKQFGQASKRTEIPIMKSCIVETFDEDFTSTKN